MKTVPVLLLSLALVACGKSESNEPSDVVKAVAHDAPADSPPDIQAPLDQYVEVGDPRSDPAQGFDLVALNAAVSVPDPALPVDYDVLANSTSKDYYKTQDAFAKKELLTQLQPKLEARVAHFQAQPYIATVYKYTNNIEGYDFQRSGFPVNVFRGSEMLYAGDTGYGNAGILYRMNVKNAQAASFFPVSDQDLARRIESLRTSGSTPRLKVFFAASMKPKKSHITEFRHYFQDDIPLTVTHMQLVDRNGTVLADYAPAQREAQEASEVQANAASIANGI